MTRLRHGLGLAIAAVLAGCGALPEGVIPDSLSPAITLNPTLGAVPTGTPPTAPVSRPISNPAPAVPTPSPVSAPAGGELSELEAYIVSACNSERAKLGTPPLASNATLQNLARSRSQDMIARNYFSHTTPDGQTVFDLLKAQGYAYSSAGENIGANTYPAAQSAQQIMQGWMNSAGHKANILNAKYGRIGVGAARRSSDGAYYYTQVFSN